MSAAGDQGVTRAAGRAVREGAPWERRSEIGLWRGMFQTVKAVLFSPRVLFRSLSYGSGVIEPMAFGLLFGSLGSMFGFFWQFLLAAAGFLSLQGATGEPYMGPFTAGVLLIIVLALVPVFVMGGMFLYAAVLHLFMVLVRGGNSGFEGTFRVVAYSQAAQIWGLVPLVGGWIGGVWQLIVQATGLREIHETSYVRVFLAFLIPAAMLLFAVVALVALVFYLLSHSDSGWWSS